MDSDSSHLTPPLPRDSSNLQHLCIPAQHSSAVGPVWVPAFPSDTRFSAFSNFWFFTCQGQVPERPVLRLGDFCAISSDRELLAQLGGILRINLLSSSLPPPWDKPLSVAVFASFLPCSNSQSSACPLAGWGDRNQWEALVGLTHLFI